MSRADSAGHHLPMPPVTTSVAPTSAATTSAAPAVTTSPAAK
ncbi:hypothetical protein [Nocardia brasiliensis]|nr:hypothetical protein [Nocardia brasiliensis]